MCFTRKIELYPHQVIYKEPSADWFKMGGEDEDFMQKDQDFYYQKWFDSLSFSLSSLSLSLSLYPHPLQYRYNAETARYEDLKINWKSDPESQTFYCGCCVRVKQEEMVCIQLTRCSSLIIVYDYTNIVLFC